jgi:signal transduction histidine kinase
MVKGTFTIESEVDKGTKVTITVPEENWWRLYV